MTGSAKRKWPALLTTSQACSTAGRVADKRVGSIVFLRTSEWGGEGDGDSDYDSGLLESQKRRAVALRVVTGLLLGSVAYLRPL